MLASTMTADTFTIIGTGIALAILMVGLFAWLRTDIREHVGRLDGRITTLDERMAKLDERMTKLDERMTRLEIELRERMAKLEGLLEGLREAISGRHAA